MSRGGQLCPGRTASWGIPMSNGISVCSMWRAGDIDPVRKEIVFERLHETPPPMEPPPKPERPSNEPAPTSP